MEEIKVSENNSIIVRLTPWDSKVFGFNTSELLSINYQNEKDIQLLIYEFEKFNVANKINFTYLRINSADFILKQLLQRNNFYFVETSIVLELPNLKKNNNLKFISRKLDLKHYEKDDIFQLKNIAKESFNFSRFHEDPYISQQKARDRYFYWIDDLVQQNKKIITYKIDNEIKAFMAYDVNKLNVELILGGVKKGYPLGPFFWSSLLEYLKEEGFIAINKVLISAANVEILKLYIALNFQIKATLFGFHKFYKLPL